MSVTTEKSAGATAIRPFTFEAAEADLEDLRARIAATRFPERKPSQIGPRARSSRRFRHSRAIGRQITIGASARRN